MELSRDDLMTILVNIPANVFFKDSECRYQLASRVCQMLNTGGKKDFSIIGKTDLEIQPDKNLGRQYYEEDCELIKKGGEKQYISEMVFPSGTYYYRIQKVAVRDNTNAIIGIVGIISDMTTEITLQKKLELLSITDKMTGVYNRTCYELFLANTINVHNLPMAIISFDFDHLKAVNDTYGHAKGDEYLKYGVSAIENNMPKGSSLYRVGGDEFVLAVKLCGAEKAGHIIQEIQTSVSSFKIGDFCASISLGMAIITDANQSIEEAVKEADSMMYKNKVENHRSRA